MCIKGRKRVRFLSLKSFHLSGGAGQDVGVTSIQDGHGRAAEELSTGSSEFNL